MSTGRWRPVQGGSTVPVQFSLGGNQGLSDDVSRFLPRLGFCHHAPGPPLTVIESWSEKRSPRSSSGLNVTGNRTRWDWKTSAGWTGRLPHKLRIPLIDGTVHEALFRFN